MALKNHCHIASVRERIVEKREEFVAKFTCTKLCCNSPSHCLREVVGPSPFISSAERKHTVDWHPAPTWKTLKPAGLALDPADR